MDEIRRTLGAHEAETRASHGKERAAVAVVLRERSGTPELLFIERARREGDPWSRHMAFPGGRLGSTDEDPRRAAERETREEVGLSLEGAEALGRLDDMEGHHVAGAPRLVISAFVYCIREPAPLALNHEVRDAFWFPVRALLDPARRVDYPRLLPDGRSLPGLLVGIPEHQVVWGLTYRFLESFFRIVGCPLPGRWQALREPSAP